MTTERQFKKAKKRVQAKKGFYAHFTSYICTISFLFIINMLTSPMHWWFYWPMLGWGIGIVSHYFGVFGLPGTHALSKDWEEREMERELRKLEKKEGTPPYLREGNFDPDLNLDEHLELKELRKNYDDSEFV
jgi:2TM domain